MIRDEGKESEQLGSGALASGMLQDFRQLSVPLWARMLVLGMVGIVFVSDVVLIAILFLQDVGFGTPALLTPKVPERWLSSAVTLLSSIFVPVVVVAYLVFAETGVNALRKKSNEILSRLIPECLREIRFPSLNEKLVVEVSPTTSHSTRCRYSLSGCQNGSTKRIDLVVSINVRKAGIVVLVRLQERLSVVDAYNSILINLRHTLEGAKREGYTLMEAPAIEKIDNQSFVALVLLRPLSNDFLWDPAQKLHFAQDFATFCHSLVSEGWDAVLS